MDGCDSRVFRSLASLFLCSAAACGILAENGSWSKRNMMSGMRWRSTQVPPGSMTPSSSPSSPGLLVWVMCLQRFVRLCTKSRPGGHTSQVCETKRSLSPRERQEYGSKKNSDGGCRVLPLKSEGTSRSALWCACKQRRTAPCSPRYGPEQIRREKSWH